MTQFSPLIDANFPTQELLSYAMKAPKVGHASLQADLTFHAKWIHLSSPNEDSFIA